MLRIMKKFKYLNIKDVERLPNATGIYAFFATLKPSRAKAGKNVFLYIGKAISIKSRVKNHIGQPTFKDNIFVPKTEKIGFIATGSEIEALILEANLIKKYQPKYNTAWRDGKSHNYVFITREKFPRVFIAHQLQTTNYKLLTSIGPFIDGGAIKQTLRVLRRIFPYRTCKTLPKKACLYKDLNLCPAPCQLKVQSAKLKVRKNIKNLVAILNGKKNYVIKNLQKEMRKASQEQDFEKAKTLRDQIFTLENVFSHSHVLKGVKLPASSTSREFHSFHSLQSFLKLKNKIKQIEGYDISNIQGKEATGSMVVFENGKPNKNKYRKFKIKITGKPNDTAMLKEIISRRLKHKEWALPQVMLIDGGKAQLNAVLQCKVQSAKFKVIALAKKNNELFIEGKEKPMLLKNLPQETANLILQIRDEAHKFAISYHKKLRSKTFLN